MDQLVPVIEFVKKNRFWITCSLLAIAMLGTWFYVSSDFKGRTASSMRKIDEKVKAQIAIMETKADVGITDASLSIPNAHPNKATEKGMDGEIQIATDSVLAAWKTRHAAQKKIMVWPTEIEKKFVAEFQKWDPPELFPEDETGNNLLSLLRIYNLQVPNTMDRICKIIGTKWEHASKAVVADMETETEDGQDARPSAILNDLDPNSVVVQWESENQDLWFDKLSKFKFHDDHRLTEAVPSPSQVYMLQQDLWLLEAMFNIVKNVNGAADANDLAIIKKIDHVVFGREALAYLGELVAPSAVAVTTKKKDTSARGNRMSDVDKINRRREARAKRKANASLELNYDGKPAFHGRYVNADFEPILADEVRKVLKGEVLPEDNLELVVSKRVPVRFAVEMDEREIPKFLTECARSELTFEVFQIRIRCHKPGDGIERKGVHKDKKGAGGSGGGGRGTDGSPASQMNGGNLGLEGGDAGSGAGGDSGADATGTDATIERSNGIETRVNYIVKVEFYGVVKIYNPVNEELLTGKKTKKQGGSSKP